MPCTSWSVDRLEVEHHAPDGQLASAQVRVLALELPAANDWLAVNRFTMSEAAAGMTHTRRPDVVRLVKGLPLGVVDP